MHIYFATSIFDHLINVNSFISKNFLYSNYIFFMDTHMLNSSCTRNRGVRIAGHTRREFSEGAAAGFDVVLTKKMNSQKVVTPVKAGVQRVRNQAKRLDSGFRRNDG